MLRLSSYVAKTMFYFVVDESVFLKLSSPFRVAIVCLFTSQSLQLNVAFRNVYIGSKRLVFIMWQ